MKEWNESKFYGLASKYYDYNQKMILSLIEKNPKAKILDIGCNDGNFTLKAREVIGARDIYAIELDKSSVKKAKLKGIHVKCHDANKRFPYEDCSFDVVISNQVLEHILDTDNFFREIHRVLRQGGYAVISSPNLSSFHNLAFLNLGMQPPGLQVSEIQVGNFLYGTKTHGHIKLFTISSLRDLAKYHGFCLEKEVGIGIYPFPIFISGLLSKILKRYCVFLTMKIRKVKSEENITNSSSL